MGKRHVVRHLREGPRIRISCIMSIPLENKQHRGGSTKLRGGNAIFFPQSLQVWHYRPMNGLTLWAEEEAPHEPSSTGSVSSRLV